MTRTYRVIIEVDIDIEDYEVEGEGNTWEDVEETLENKNDWDSYNIYLGSSYVNSVEVESYVEV